MFIINCGCLSRFSRKKENILRISQKISYVYFVAVRRHFKIILLFLRKNNARYFLGEPVAISSRLCKVTKIARFYLDKNVSHVGNGKAV